MKFVIIKIFAFFRDNIFVRRVLKSIIYKEINYVNARLLLTLQLVKRFKYLIQEYYYNILYIVFYNTAYCFETNNILE